MGSSGYGNELFGSVESGGFFNQLSENQILNEGCAPVSQLISSLTNATTERRFGDRKTKNLCYQQYPVNELT